MKNILNLTKFSLLFGMMIMISSCDNEPEISDISRITYFPEFAFDGPSSYVIPCNSDFQVPPVTATESGNPLPVTTSVLGLLGPVPSVDINKADYYVETSSAVNQDGFAGEVVRTYWVACTGDLVNSLEGLYTSTITRTRSSVTYVDKQYVLIRKVGDNTYEVSNADGGWYELGRNLGPGYRSAGATVTAVDISTNSFTFGPPVEVGGFGGPIQLNSMTVDPATKTIVFTSYWDFSGGYTFTATLTQVQL